MTTETTINGICRVGDVKRYGLITASEIYALRKELEKKLKEKKQ